MTDIATLQGVVQRGEYTEKMAVKIVKQIVDAVKFVHKHNIVHRDVKVDLTRYHYLRHQSSFDH